MASGKEGRASLCYWVTCAKLDVGSCEICCDAIDDRLQDLGTPSVLKLWSVGVSKDACNSANSIIVLTSMNTCFWPSAGKAALAAATSKPASPIVGVFGSLQIRTRKQHCVRRVVLAYDYSIMLFGELHQILLGRSHQLPLIGCNMSLA